MLGAEEPRTNGFFPGEPVQAVEAAGEHDGASTASPAKPHFQRARVASAAESTRDHLRYVATVSGEEGFDPKPEPSAYKTAAQLQADGGRAALDRPYRPLVRVSSVGAAGMVGTAVKAALGTEGDAAAAADRSSSPSRRLKRAGPQYMYRASTLKRGGLAGILEPEAAADADAGAATDAAGLRSNSRRGSNAVIKTSFAQPPPGRRASVAAALDMTAPPVVPAPPSATVEAASAARANKRLNCADHIFAAGPASPVAVRRGKAAVRITPDGAASSRGLPSAVVATSQASEHSNGDAAVLGSEEGRAGRRLERTAGMGDVLWSPEAPAMVRPGTADGSRPAGGAAAPRDVLTATFRPGRRPASAQWNRSSLVLG